jgi:hypothetical protein
LTVLSRLRAEELLGQLAGRVQGGRVGRVADHDGQPPGRVRAPSGTKGDQRCNVVDDHDEVARRELACALSDTCGDDPRRVHEPKL